MGISGLHTPPAAHMDRHRRTPGSTAWGHTVPAALAGSAVRTDRHLGCRRSTPWLMTWTRSGALLHLRMHQRSSILLLLTDECAQDCRCMSVRRGECNSRDCCRKERFEAAKRAHALALVTCCLAAGSHFLVFLPLLQPRLQLRDSCSSSHWFWSCMLCSWHSSANA